MQDSQIKENMIRNFEKKMGQFQVASAQKEWAKMKPEDIYNLLMSCSGHNKILAKNVLLKIAQKKWTITATAHTGGKDANAPLHISIRPIGELAYHFNCKETPGKGLHIFEISQKPANI